MSTSVGLIRASAAADGSQGSADSDGTAGFGLSISADGGLVVFSSLASNLTVGDLNGKYDVFIKDLTSGAIQIVSASGAGAAANGASIYPDLTADGRYVVFSSQATNLVSSDTNGTTYDIFRKDLITGEIVLADQSSGGAQPTSFTFSRDSAASSDGRYITFMSYSSLDPDRLGGPAVYLKDMQDGSLVNVSYGTGIASGQSISADGRYVAFVSGPSFSTNLFVYDAQTGQRHQWTTSASSGSGNLSGAIDAVISANGRYVAFTSQLGSLVTGDTNGSTDVFRLDLHTGGIELVSAGPGNVLGNGESSRPTISADGRYVAFTTWATNFASVDANGNSDVYVKDLLTGELTLLSRNAAGDTANDASFNPSISADGQHIAFTSRATNIVSGDTNGVLDVFVASLTPSNVVPVAAPDSVHAFEQNGTAPGPAVSGNVLENDTDGDVGDTISVVSLESMPVPIGIVGSATEGAYGSLTLNADGTFTYVLDQANATVDALESGDVLSDVFTYTIRDSKGAEASSTLTVLIDGVSDSGSLPATADAIAAKGELVLLAELAEAAYHLRTDDAATLDLNEAERPE